MRHVRLAGLALLLVIVAGCAKPDSPPSPPASVPSVAASAPTSTAGSKSCPATGLWAQCSLIYHLDRAGLAPRVDSSGTPAEPLLSVRPLIVKIGRNAVLELYVYPDSIARIADAKKLDRTAFVIGTAPQTMNRQRTLIESSNVIGLLASLNDQQRERVFNALTAGAPQPPKP